MSDKGLFEKIAQKEIPAHIVWENEEYIAFLDIFPLAEGQVVVIPKENIGENLFELNDDEYTELLLASKTVAKKMKSVLGCDRIFMLIEGLEVAHVHVKLIPNIEGIGTNEMSTQKADDNRLAELKSKF